ncbi:hypothetical protein F5B20DRAFT_119011 [Whalleya microplaca]|nr:hypothetical protein F5B20DRAFT_119011 [Whalleya microplaca]
MEPGTPINTDKANWKTGEDTARSSREWKTGGQQKDAPTEDEYRDILQDLVALHETMCRTADTIENMSRTRPCIKFWDHIWLTFHMAGATTEEVWYIVRYTWLKMLQKTGRLGPGEWEMLKEFIKSARDTIIECDRIFASWNHEKEGEFCLEIYKVLREFPIAKPKKRNASWQAQDGLMCKLIYDVSSQNV